MYEDHERLNGKHLECLSSYLWSNPYRRQKTLSFLENKMI